MEQHEIGEHLDRAVRNVPVEERCPEGPVSETQQQVTVGSQLGLDPADARHALPHSLDNPFKDRAVILVQKLRDSRQVVSIDREMLRASCGLLPALRRADVEIGDVPVFEKLAKRAGRLETLKLPKS